MITRNDFKILFENWSWIMDAQTEGLSQEGLLLQPKPGGNSMLWVLGHLVEGMKDLILTLGGQIPQGYEVYKRFERTSEPVLENEQGLPGLAKIKADFQSLSELAIETLEKQSDEFFEGKGWAGTKGATALFFAFHLSYHIGQLEYLRNLVGKTEKVI